MNRILVDTEGVELKKITKQMDVAINQCKGPFGVTKIFVKVLKDTSLEIDYHFDDMRLDITIDVNPNVTFNIYEQKKGEKGKIQYTFNLLQNSVVNSYKFNYMDIAKEMIIFNLNGEKSAINYYFKALSVNKETYDLVINHNAKETVSNIKINIVNIMDGKVITRVSSYVPKGIKNCNVSQNSRIINLVDNKCEIRPNLYIDEFDTVANHAALIGGFNSDELFYLKTRGVSEHDANKLLVTGFLISDLNHKKIISQIKKVIKEYWR